MNDENARATLSADVFMRRLYRTLSEIGTKKTLNKTIGEMYDTAVLHSVL